jgi:methylmalonyl-CoA epimerase
MAKIKGVNHLGFAVKNLEESVRSAEENLGGELIIKFESTKQKYKGALIQLGESIISLIESTDENGFIAKFVESRGEGIQHIGLEVDNLEEYIKHLESKGIRVDKTDMADANFPEALVGPRTGFGVVLQLMQWKTGTMDVSPEGKERIRQKYREVPGLRLIE